MARNFAFAVNPSAHPATERMLEISRESIKPFPLFDLPNELIDEVFKHLCHHCVGSNPWTDDALEGKRALASLCRTNRFIKVRVQPLLYHSGCTGRDFDLLARTLVSKPDLALHLRALYLGPGALTKAPTWKVCQAYRV